MKKIKKCDVAGQFYPSNPSELNQMLDDFIADAPDMNFDAKAIIAPHAGYIYSGPIAATAYKAIASEEIDSVLLLSPSHNYSFQGMALHDADAFETPFGAIELNDQQEIFKLPETMPLAQAFTPEHSLETQLPFIKKFLPNAKLTPIVCGAVNPESIAILMEYHKDSMIIVSSDLSHFYQYNEAQSIDNETAEIIQSKVYQFIDGDRACGHIPIKGLCLWADQNNYTIEPIDLRNSGDTQGSADQVVGYGSFVVY